MNREQIIQMAREAGFYQEQPMYYDESMLEAFAKLVAEHSANVEREACAIVCDDINAKYKWPQDTAERVASQWCADAIRAREDKHDVPQTQLR